MFEDMEYKIAGRTKSILIVSLFALLIWQYSAGHPYTSDVKKSVDTFYMILPYIKWCFARLFSVL